MDALVGQSDPEGLRQLLLVIAVSGMLWYCLRIVLAVALTTVARRRPGLRSAAVRCAPAALRPFIARALIGGLLGAGLAGPAAWADTPPCSAPGSGVPVLDRADLCRAEAKPSLPIAPPAAQPGPARTGPAAAGPADGAADAPRAQVITVAAGDSLWSISSRLLGRTAAAADIAAAWPLLWAQNRSLIGPDPDLIHPGTELRIPADIVAEVQR
jgi:hypothetical protein